MKLHVLIIFIFVSFALNGCYSEPPVTSEEAHLSLNNPEKTFRIRLESVPSGASIYGYIGGSTGSYLGKTPMTFSYGEVRYELWGTHIGETLTITEKEHFRLVGYCHDATVTFRCFLVKEGYRRASVIRRIELEACRDTTALDPGYLAGQKKIYTVILDPVATDIGMPPKQQQQQQQQQQQTVVIPGGQSETPQMGTIMVSSNVHGSDVYVDGMFVGNTPANLKLKDGIHIIEVKKSGYSTYRKELRVFGGSELSLRAELSK